MSEYLYQRAFLKAQELSSFEKPVCLEFGVGWGSTYQWQANQIINNFPSTTLIGFDSWQGLPEETVGVWCPDRHNKGCLSFGKDVVLQKLRDIGIGEDSRFKFIDGFFNESLTNELQLTINNVIFINIDVDIHLSTIEVLNFVKPFLKKDTIIYWDDWKDPNDLYNGKWGEHLAWEEWSSLNRDIKVETVEINEYNQRYMRIL